MAFLNTSYDANTKIWSGIKTEPVYGPNSSIGEEVLKSLMSDPDHISQICYPNGNHYTNRQIANLSIRVAQHFQELQFQQCQVVGICASNSDYVAPLFFGSMLSGLSVNTLDPSFDKDGIKHIYSITKPSIMFCDGSIYGIVKEAFNEINLKATIYTMKDHIEGVPQITEFLRETGSEKNFKPEPLKMGSNQRAVIICSSGTTGLPKGVCLSHNCVLSKNQSVFKLENMLCFSTLYWVSGLITLVSGSIGGVTRIISDKSFNSQDFFNITEKYKLRSILMTPSQLAMSIGDPDIKNRDLTSLELCFFGGSAVPYILVEKFKSYSPDTTFISGYGLTEVGGGVSGVIVQPNGSVGKLTHNIEIKIVDDDGKFMGPEEQGEICVRSPFIWEGYYNNPKETANIYKADGWVHSGDIGYMNNDGYLFIVDRKKDILKYNNFHFSPTEIENVIYNMKNVAEVCVCGIPDITFTFLPAAAIVKIPGSQLSENEVYDHVAKKMAHFKHLRGGVFFLDELPKTASGKILRRKVSDICAQLKDSKE